MIIDNQKIKNILWDFDGVIMDSMAVRDKGFEIVLKKHSREEVEKLMKFHRENGGLSRYVKFRYFFEKIKGREISEEEVNEYASWFSEVMLRNLIDENLLIEDSLRFIQENHQRYQMHIVSGSDQKELRHICQNLQIAEYFHSINGSPTPKKKLVKKLLEKNSYSLERTILIGDSVNDYEAAVENNISFYGYNNVKISNLGENYIQTFKDYEL